ncbi:type II toxin-antitoxin system PrlF family antitoxin [Cytobacillus sp. S13-E01]|uniref:AbrB/MazE/SpoVT family DNA-binding domain-containing protein n=1 Tax=Cytobacillus sp. S13-E01 TaxID=3031326 RepID=UPI0023D8B3CB|nr:type II toxin-antitoxin system PrlF family antitoxin [Cytobacillus sp. S13-E01]MDF0729010.1 type II toxin-antitoxin system PrlF family antitoxin [Cytobacillus sp. S13-E01]
MAYQPQSYHEGSHVTLSQKSTLTSKGQVTIPQKIREAIQASTGDQIEFSLNESGEVIIKAIKKDSLLSLFGSMPSKEETVLEWETIRSRASDEKTQGELL